MKLLFFITLTICMLPANAQKKETYYDVQWKPSDPLTARFYSTVEKTDSGWLRNDYYISGLKQQMKALFSDSDCDIHNGYMYFFYPNGTPSIVGKKLNGKNEGLCLSFHNNGMCSDSAFFRNGQQIGTRMKWHPNGYPSDSVGTINDSMQIQLSWFDNGNISSAGYLKYGETHGKWQYFHNNGKLAALEVCNQGKLVSAEYYNEEGILQTTAFKDEVPASFKGGMNGWTAYLEINLYWPANLHFKEGNMAVTQVNLTISEEGKVENVYVTIPFHPEFDRIALKVINQSPKWKPALQNNRRVKYRFIQHVTFREPDE